MNKYIAELFGTFWLVPIVGAAIYRYIGNADD